ncbi:unnamed protein product [Brassica napus]|uniref:(rape) hypothetical protein n=1 Tax=Brassica napus TaxID=3708 RepID=A0A816JKW6_BRANA|nr:unnamed protein product [Brassica napus]
MSKEMAKINPDMLMLSDDQTPKIGASLSQSKRRKISIVGIKPNLPDLNVKPFYDFDEEEKGEITKTFQNLAGADSNWEMFDKDFKTFQKLPKVPSSDYCFFHSDKETISVGTQLIVIGREIGNCGVSLRARES